MANRLTHNLIARKMPQDHQQEGLHMSTRITYILRSSKCHKTISKKACKWQPESHTFYKHANATRPSAKGPTHVNQNHLLPISMQMPQDHQQKGLHMSTRITYCLWAGKCHKTISKWACTCQPESLTYWEQANAKWPSARGPTHVNQNHLLPIKHANTTRPSAKWPTHVN
jgi:hypothetical protein